MLSSTFILAALAGYATATVQFLGVAIAGGDFGCQIDGTCPTGSVQLPLSSLGGGDGKSQMQHFVTDDKVNMFRLPVSWQFLVNNNLGGTLDSTNLGKYDQLMQACLATGASCMIDIHNFARWNGAVIGQGGPTDDQFVSLWTQLATKYATNAKVVFELMNEPHDLDINIWAATCQKVVTGIRNAGATTQMILLPGTNFDSAATLVSSGSADALMKITNVDGTTDNLLLDIHKYLDEDNSGTHQTCTTDNIDAFTTVATFLRTAGRKGFISESGASTDATCITAFCSQNNFIQQNSDVFTGLVGWGAGSFSTSYVMSMTPSKSNNKLTDNALVSQCLIAPFLNAANTVAASASVAPSSAAPVATTAATTTALPTTAASANTATPSTSAAQTAPGPGVSIVSSFSAITATTLLSQSVPTIGSTTMILTVSQIVQSATSEDPLVMATGTPTKSLGSISAASILATASGSASNATATGTAKSTPSTVTTSGGVRFGITTCLVFGVTLLGILYDV